MGPIDRPHGGGETFMNPAAIVDALGYPSAGLGILIETAGVPFPGELLLLAAGAWAAARHHSIVLVILFGFIGATAGADLGYFLGYRGGRPFMERFGALFRVRPEHIARSELFFARHGDKAILAARFVIGLRTWGSMLAGMAHMPFWRFQIFSAIGGLAWAIVIGAAGYLLGSNLDLIETIIRGIGIGGLAIVPITILIPPTPHPPPTKQDHAGPRRGRAPCRSGRPARPPRGRGQPSHH